MKGLILSGGSGTRLRPLTHTGPKQLIPVANKPVLFYAVEDLVAAGITEIGVVLGNNMPEQVRNALRDGASLGAKITYVEQGEPKGIAHAVACAERFMGSEPFVVYLGDNILRGGIREFVEEFNAKKCDASILLSHVKNPQMFGVAEVDSRGDIVGLVEKPKHPKSDLALVGVYLFRQSVFEVIARLKPSWRNELEITEAIDAMVRSGRSVLAHVVKGWWKDTGKPEDILEANHLLLDEMKPHNAGVVEEGASVNGRVVIGEGSVVQRGSAIRGPVAIGKNCRVGGGAYIGPYTSIGDGCTILGGEIEASIVVGNARIECGCRIINSLVGAGTTISSNSARPHGYRFVIGENSQVVL